MVVSLVLEKKKPGLLAGTGKIGVYRNRAGVNLFGFVQIPQKTPLFQYLGPNGSHIHQSPLPGRRLRAVDLPPGLFVKIQRPFEHLLDPFLKTHIFQFRGKSRMPAMIRPVSIQDPQFRQSRIPAQRHEIVPAKPQILRGHSKPPETGNFIKIPPEEIPENRHIRGKKFPVPGRKGRIRRSLPGIHRIDKITLYPVQSRRGKRHFPGTENIHQSLTDPGLLPRPKLHALFRPVGPLVVLAGKELRREDPVPLFRGNPITKKTPVALGLGKNPGHRGLKVRVIQTQHIVTVQNP